MSSWVRKSGDSRLGSVRTERDARKRQTELDRRTKERTKLSALEQARLEVETYENSLEVLLSVHKEQNTPMDWRRFAAALPPHQPLRLSRHVLTVLLNKVASESLRPAEEGDGGLEGALLLDEREHESARAEYDREFAQWETLHSLAQRVLAGEPKAYTQAVSEFSNLGEISNLGSSIHMTVHDASLVECVLKVNGRDLIPSETKSLTTAGRLVVKPMPKARFHEIYQDYVCGCILRLAREMLALLPVETILLTAIVDGIDFRTGHAAELPVLSMIAPRSVIERLDFERLNPSDALENFQHRGDVASSRKSDAFVSITPFRADEITIISHQMTEFAPLLARVRQFRVELSALMKPVISTPIASSESGEVL